MTHTTHDALPNSIKGVEVKLHIDKESIDLHKADRIEAGDSTIHSHGKTLIVTNDSRIIITYEDGVSYSNRGLADSNKHCLLVLYLGIISKPYYIVCDIDNIAQLDKIIVNWLSMSDSTLVCTSTHTLLDEQGLNGSHTTSSNWPSKFIRASWAELKA